MSGDWLALGAVAALALAGRRRGSRNACEGPFFHTTTWNRLQSIAQRGLEPGYGSRFGGWYQGHSRDRIFVAQGAWEAGEWYDRVSSVVEQNAEIREEDELPTIVPVMLRLNLQGQTLHPDDAAKMDGMPCSFYVTETIGPAQIWFFDGSKERWRPVSEWDDSDPMTALRDWEEECEDPENWDDCWITFTLIQRDDNPGAFAPERHNDPAAQQDWTTQRQGGSPNAAITWRQSASPLAYHGTHPKRLALCDPAHRAKTKSEYFKKLDPCIVAFVDFSTYGKGRDQSLFIHYFTVRDDQRRRGVARKLIEELYQRHASRIGTHGTLDWGKLMSDGAVKLYGQMRAAHPSVPHRGKIW